MNPDWREFMEGIDAEYWGWYIWQNATVKIGDF